MARFPLTDNTQPFHSRTSPHRPRTGRAPQKMPHSSAVARIRPGRCAVLATACGVRRKSGVPRRFLHGNQQGPSWEIRALVMHVYPNGIKGFGHELASNLQGRLKTTISVI